MAAPPQLVEIIKDELRAPIGELVRTLVAELAREELARMNGAEGAAGAPAGFACGEWTR